jgi:hypothetical protein
VFVIVVACPFLCSTFCGVSCNIFQSFFRSTLGAALKLEVAPVCMTYEDYYAAFAPGSHPSLSVSPQAGRMDRRGGEKTILNVVCSPNGYAGTFAGDLVINLPEDNSKICYKITAKSY